MTRIISKSILRGTGSNRLSLIYVLAGIMAMMSGRFGAGWGLGMNVK